MANESQQLDIIDKLLELMQADATLSTAISGWYDHIPDDIPSHGSMPALCIDWSGDTHSPAAIGGYRKVKSTYTILIAVDDWEQVEARRSLVELSGIVTDFLSKVSVMQQAGFWERGMLADNGGQNVRVGRSNSSDSNLRLGESGFVYSAMIVWEAEYRKARVMS